jgi:ribose transport system ATP-binding protein
LLLLHEPTQGVDVGARQQIFAILEDLAAAGTRILIASSDHEELARLCSRVVIIADGCPVVTLDHAEVTERAITESCLSTERGRVVIEETITAGTGKS